MNRGWVQSIRNADNLCIETESGLKKQKLVDKRKNYFPFMDLYGILRKPFDIARSRNAQGRFWIRQRDDASQGVIFVYCVADFDRREWGGVAHGVRCYKCGRNGSFDCATLRSGRQSGNVVSWRTMCAATIVSAEANLAWIACENGFDHISDYLAESGSRGQWRKDRQRPDFSRRRPAEMAGRRAPDAFGSKRPWVRIPPLRPKSSDFCAGSTKI